MKSLCPLSGRSGALLVNTAVKTITHYHISHCDLKVTVFEGHAIPDPEPDATPSGVLIITDDPVMIKRFLDLADSVSGELKDHLRAGIDALPVSEAEN
jgi:hypothetical protein